jgi:polysaccharide pyruvyl transferase WcaK-like protein
VKYIFPRVIFGNRGDLGSRWGVLAALKDLGSENVVIFRKYPEDVPAFSFSSLPYGKARNLVLPPGYWKYFRKTNVILWAAGLDLQDDSSLAKLVYLWVVFTLYRLAGMKIYCLFQGAGPLKTRPGHWLAARALSQVSLFIARDPGTYNLIGNISPGTRKILAHDAIFLPGFEQEAAGITVEEKQLVDEYIGDKSSSPVVGINIRQWFHLNSRILPYQMNQAAYMNQSQDKMDQLIHSMVDLIRRIRKDFNARVLLISAYQPNVVPWEDDLPWLEQLAKHFEDDDGIILTEKPLTMPQYYALMSRLDVMIGMRLHSSLIALRMGVPSLNISYTLKGRDILEYMGLGRNVVDLNDFLKDPSVAHNRFCEVMANLDTERLEVNQHTQKSIMENMDIFSTFMKNIGSSL